MSENEQSPELHEVREDVATIKETLRWHKWLLFGLAAATLSPKLSGPSPTDVAVLIFGHAL